MLRAHVGDDASVLQVIGGLSTFGRLIEPEEIAETIRFCADHPVINGAVLHANLGQKES
jgi:NAD(P)-dependent dehydrogenase (short-subunit alcohol dehydrogenase family)